MKFEPKDYIALGTAFITISSILWQGGRIQSQLEATAEAVKTMAPIVNRLDASTAGLAAKVESNTVRLGEQARRIENLESIRFSKAGK